MEAFVAFGDLPAQQQSSSLIFAFYFLSRLGREAVLAFFALSWISCRRRRAVGVARGPLRDRQIRDLTAPPGYSSLSFRRVCSRPSVGLFFFGFPFDPTRVALNIVGLNGVVTGTLDGNGPLWTLAYEIWFYVTGGAVGLLFSRRAPLAGTICLCACLLVFSILEARYLLYWLSAGIFWCSSQPASGTGSSELSALFSCSAAHWRWN